MRSLGLDAGRDVVEKGLQVVAQESDSGDDDDGNQCNHQAILDGGCPTVVAHREDLGLELDEVREHFGPFRKTRKLRPGEALLEL